MRKTIYLKLLTFFAIWSQEIRALLQENIVKSSNLHVRQKRIIDTTPNENRTVTIEEVPYIVNIQRDELGSVCGGSILTANIVLTAAHCVLYNGKYSVLSGSEYRNRGTYHNVTGKLIYPYYSAFKYIKNDLALITICPPIDLVHSPNRRIELATNDVPEGTLGTVSGWGSIERTELHFPEKLRSITVPIMSEDDCEWHYGQISRITNRNICTFDMYRKTRCNHGDSGGPLVAYDQLIGVLSWSEPNSNREYPDVFMKVSYPLYRRWIISNIRIIEGWL